MTATTRTRLTTKAETERLTEKYGLVLQKYTSYVTYLPCAHASGFFPAPVPELDALAEVDAQRVASYRDKNRAPLPRIIAERVNQNNWYYSINVPPDWIEQRGWLDQSTRNFVWSA